MKNIFRYALCGLAAASAVLPVGAGAEPRPAELAAGLTQGDVLARWGAPEEKEEREVKREDTWRYRGGSWVAFAEGKVVRWEIGAGLPGAIPLSPAMAAAQNSRADEEVVVSDSDVADMLGQIAEKAAEKPGQPGGGAPMRPNPGALDKIP